MGKTILSSTIAKIGTPISEENNIRRSKAFDDIAGCLERCYREFIKLNSMNQSQDTKHHVEAYEGEEKMVNLINSLKDEINGELLRLACFGSLVEKGGLKDVIKNEISRVIQRYTQKKDEETFDLAKENVVNDFNEMDTTMDTKKLDHIRRYPLLDDEIAEKRKIVQLVQPPRRTAGPRRSGLAPWQRDIMAGMDTGFFADATQPVNNENIIDLNEFRRRRGGEGR